MPDYRTTIVAWLLTAAAAAGLTYVLIKLLLGWLRDHIVAHVTPRSSHVVETPEGAGIVVVPVVIVTTAVSLGVLSIPPPYGMSYAIVVAISALILSIVGFVDDARGLPVLFRLVIQFALVGAVVYLLPEKARIFPPSFVPFVLERTLISLGGVWFVNLVNFMDGIDLISVVETAAIAIGILLLAYLGHIPRTYGWIGAAMLGAVIGFAPWNSPPARLFLGDSGSIPLGFIIGVMLLHMAEFAANAFASAVILPLYYLADSTITLLRRCWRRERFWRAHREHFYQQAVRNGFTVGEVVRRIALVNAALIALSIASTNTGKLGATILFAIAAAIVGLTLRSFAYGKQPAAALQAQKQPFDKEDRGEARS